MNGNRDKRRAKLELSFRSAAGTVILRLDGPDAPEPPAIALRFPAGVPRGLRLRFRRGPTEDEGPAA